MLVYDQYLYPEKPDLNSDVVVFHAGFCSTSANYSYGKDTRDYYLIHYVTRGKGIYRVGGHVYHLHENDGFLIMPNATIVHTADKKDPWDVCWIGFFGNEAEALLNAAGLDKDNLIFRYDKDDFLENCIKEIYNESRNHKNMAYIKSYFYQFMGKLIEIHQEQQKIQWPKASNFNHFEDAMIYIRRNIRYQISVDHLANYLRLNPSQVYRIFKANTGKSPQMVISDMRMEKACEFLLKTDLPIREISEWLDFEYPSHFTKQFKSKMHLSPSEYRKLHGKPEQQAGGVSSDGF